MLTFVNALALVLVSTSAAAEVLTWDCSFTYRTDETGRSEEEMNLIFKVDTASGRAIMEGNLGLVDLELHIGENAFSFMEHLASGVVQTTTITRDGEAVHSRNTVMLGDFVAAQHFGRCSFQ